MHIADYRHVVWDWNGTLLDDVWLAVETINTMLRKRRMAPIDRHDYLRHFDFPVVDYYRRVGFDLDKEDFAQVAIEFIELYESRRFECRLHRDAPRAIDALARAGIGQSVLSATQNDSLRAYVEHFDLARRFEEILGLPDHYAHGKTDLARDWMRRTAPRPQETILVGDTTHDAEVAEALGIDCILVARGHQSADKLAATGRPVAIDIAALIQP